MRDPSTPARKNKAVGDGEAFPKIEQQSSSRTKNLPHEQNLDR
jgi:hypothetical protein